jgi:hypothetical protein
MSAAPRILDRVTRVTPLGIRFWDEVTSSPVLAPLSVMGYFASRPDRRFQPVRNHSNVYAFHGMPGTRAVEHGAGDAAFWSAQTAPRPFEIEVQDPSGQFLPARFTALVPFRGIFELPSSPPLLRLPGVPLYSGPARPVTAGMAAVRLELYEVSGRPAAWARLEAAYSPLAAPARGMSDAQGRATLLFPYPEPVEPAGGSPPAAPGVPLQQQVWPVGIQAWYSPVAPPLDLPGLPDLASFFAQRPAPLWSDAARSQPFSGTAIQFGRETGQVLFVTPS